MKDQPCICGTTDWVSDIGAISETGKVWCRKCRREGRWVDDVQFIAGPITSTPSYIALAISMKKKVIDIINETIRESNCPCGTHQSDYAKRLRQLRKKVEAL